MEFTSAAHFPSHGVVVVVANEDGLDLEHGRQAAGGGQPDEPEVVKVELDVVQRLAGLQGRRSSRLVGRQKGSFFPTPSGSKSPHKSVVKKIKKEPS